jgi:predicted flap endonuclease-1-like 5' DNA nuclease
MFEEWGFLIGEMIVLIIIAALLGLLVGWIIWGRRGGGDDEALETCRKERAARDARIKALEDELAAAQAIAREARADADMAHEVAETAREAARKSEAGAEIDAAADYDGDGVVEGTDEGIKPATLVAARDGGADDLKLIKGIGPKLEKLCNSLGFYHFDQIAAWSADEIAWVDANLEGFKGRVSRDNWVAQAKVLAEGGSTDFADRVKDGEVYD